MQKQAAHRRKVIASTGLSDRIHWAEKRYAVRDVHVAAPAGVTIFYKCALDG